MNMTLKDIDTSFVTVGKPTDGGCVYTSFNDSPTFATDATTKVSSLDGNWESLGDLSEDGFTISNSMTVNDFKGWHGSVVLTSRSDEKNQIKLAFIEVNRPSVAKLRYGAKNVQTGEDGSVSHIKAKTGVDAIIPLIIDELESNGYLRRTVIKRAKVDSFDDIPHQQGSLLVYGATLTILEGEEAFDIWRAKPVEA